MQSRVGVGIAMMRDGKLSVSRRVTVVKAARSVSERGGSEQTATSPEARKLQYPAALRRRDAFDVIDDNESCGFIGYMCGFVAGLCMLVAGVLGFALNGFEMVWLMLTVLGGVSTLAGAIGSLSTNESVTFDAPPGATAKPAAERMVTVSSGRPCCLPCMGRSEKTCPCFAIRNVVVDRGDNETPSSVVLHIPESCGGGTIRTYKVRNDAEQEAANWRAYLAGEL